MTNKLIVANWKMNCSMAEASNLARAAIKNTASLPGVDVVICPPFTLLHVVKEVLKSQNKIGLGAQDCHWEEKGAYTGDISPIMLKDAGCEWVILGHSERRQYHFENDIHIAQKVQAAHRCGLKVILCVGETIEQRNSGETLNVIKTQLGELLTKECHAENTVIAYEPVWAIGSGLTPGKQEIADAHGLIHSATSRYKVLYGGSANDTNAAEFLAIDGVDGLLVGGASLVEEKFATICRSFKG
jgi:triosephosphate isomerase (TIM)